MKIKILKAISPIIAIFIFSIALWFLYGELQKYHYTEILSRMSVIPPGSLALAFLFTMANYVVLTGFDALALRHIRKKLTYPKIALTSFITYSFTHNIGFSVLSSGSVRYYLYSGFGLTALEIANVIVFCTVTFIFGVVTLGGAILVLEPYIVPDFLTPSWTSARPLGVMLLSISAAYVFFSSLRKVPVSFKGRDFSLPGLGISTGQLAVAVMDWVFVSAILYTLLPETRPGYAEFIGFFVLANFAAMLSHVPGGLGVFESIMLFLLSPYVEAGSSISALLLWRGVYYILPFIISLILFGAYEAVQRREALRRAALSIGLSELAPHFIAVGAFAGGVVLIMTGALPLSEARRAYVEGVFPRLVSDISHVMAGLAGTALLFCAGLLQRRIKGAFTLAAALCISGIFFSIFRSLDYWVALYLAAYLAVLIPSRDLFYRTAPLLTEPLSTASLSAFAMAVIAFLWLGFYMYDGVSPVDFFSVQGEGRFMRSLASVTVLSIIFFASRFAASRAPGRLAGKDLRLARAIARGSRESAAGLALAGDRQVFFSANGRAFIMHDTVDSLRVAYVGPFGDEGEKKETVWRFHGLTEPLGGPPAFYSAKGADIMIYEDIGLAHIKIGEQGYVDLREFKLYGPARESLLKLRREGYRFEVIKPGGASRHIVRLNDIARSWQRHTGLSERRLVSGRFQPRYLNEFPLGMVRRGGDYIGFANILPGAGREEVYVDLIRYLPGAPGGMLDFIFVNAALYGKLSGFKHLSLGLMPLKKTDPALPILGSAGLYPHGEHFNDAGELRSFKEGFRPLVEDRFLCYPPALPPNRVLEEIAGFIES